ncbi:MAG: hypothetical protein J6C06_08210 [Lachnospiraceae bacterium]|nr:hypothetical protein [Lachnospiraceae bacterium]
MSKNAGQNKKSKKTIGGVITTILATIIVIIASLFGIGGEETENPNDNLQGNTDIVSEEYVDIDEEDSQTTIEEESEEIVSEEAEVESESELPEEEEVVLEDEPEAEESEESISEEPVVEEVTLAEVTFRNQKLLDQHYDKHGIEMGFASAEEYELAAYKVIIHPDTLHKIEAEDGDDVYYREETNEFVVVSQDGYIRTYFNPSAGIDYYNRQ